MDATILTLRSVYEGWLRLSVCTLAMPNGAREERHVEDHGVAVGVLPYDPVRRVALLVTQPRAPLILLGEAPLLEVPAGRLDDGTPEEAARRETLEEVGVRLKTLEPVAAIWSMPAISTERLHLFLAEYGAANRIAAGGGAATENECITVHELSLTELWARVEAGTLTDGKTLLLVQALRIRRPELFAAS